MLSPSDLPRKDGIAVGHYRLRLGTLSEQYPGARFVDGVAEPVAGKHVQRLHAAHGPALHIEPYDEATALAAAEWLRSHHREQRAAQILAEAGELLGWAGEEPADETPEQPEPEPSEPTSYEQAREVVEALDNAQLVELAKEHGIEIGGRGRDEVEDDVLAAGIAAGEVSEPVETEPAPAAGRVVEPPAVPAPTLEQELAELETMGKEGLQDYASRAGIHYDGRWKESKLRKRIAEALRKREQAD